MYLLWKLIQIHQSESELLICRRAKLCPIKLRTQTVHQLHGEESTACSSEQFLITSIKLMSPSCIEGRTDIHIPALQRQPLTEPGLISFIFHFGQRTRRRVEHSYPSRQFGVATAFLPFKFSTYCMFRIPSGCGSAPVISSFGLGRKTRHWDGATDMLKKKQRHTNICP